MTEITLLDWVVARLRFWRPPPPGMPTLAELWSEAGPVAAPAAAAPRPRARPPGRRLRLAADAGPLPLGLLSGLALALAGRAFTVGAEPATPVALVLLAGAAAAGALAVGRGEVSATDPPLNPDDASAEPGPRLAVLGAALAAGVVAGLAARDNRAGLDVLLPWAAAVILAGIALGGARRGPGRRRRIEGLSGPRAAATAGAVAALTVVALIVRSTGLPGVPAEMTSVHAELLTAVHALHGGDAAIVAPSSTGGWYPLPVIGTALLAPLAGGLGFGALKLGSLLAGLAAVPFIYLLGRELAGRAAGLCAAALTAVASWPDLVSRLGLPVGWYPALAAAALWLLMRGIRSGRRAAFAGCGLAVGLALLSDPAARSLLAAAVVILLVAVAAAVGRRRRMAIGLAVVVVIAAITGLPALAAAPVSAPAAGPLGWLGAAVGERDAHVFVGLADRTGRVLALPVLDDGGAWFHGGTGRPALDPVAASLLVVGLGVAVALAVTRRRLDWAALVLALPLLMLPAITAPLRPELAPSPVRCAGAIAPVFVVAGAALAAVAQGLRGGFDGAAGRRLGVAAAVLAVAASAVAGRSAVHGRFAEAWNGSTWNASELGEVVRGALAVGVPPERIRVVPSPHWVDTRLVAFEAGLPGRDLAVAADRLDAVAGAAGPHLFLIHPNDRASLAILERRLPRATTTRHPSERPGHSFVSVLTLAAGGGR